MKKSELIALIKKIEEQIFYNQMIDHWTEADKAYDREKNAELREFQRKLREGEYEEDEV